MYYQGNIKIVERGDAPAQEVIDRNARSLAQRAADETQEELRKVMSRVDNIYGSYENFSNMESTLNSSLEYVEGIQELEEILKDHIKKKKYKQQVTIFIVGYQNVCHEKLTLLQQVNEFFMTNTRNFEKENWDDPTPEIDLDDVASKIEDSLNTAEELTGRLAEINKEMVSYLTSHSMQKGNHKAKKKVEKTLQQAKDDINSLSERLLAAQAELDSKEEKMSTLLKQVEAKHMEVQRYKTAAEVAKKSLKNTERLQEEFDKRGQLLQEYQNKVESLGLELAQTSLSKAKSEERFSSSGQDNLNKIAELEELVQQKQVALDEAKRDLQRLHEMQIVSLQQSHQAEMEQMKKTHAAEVKQLMKELRKSKHNKKKAVEDIREEVAEHKAKLENIEEVYQSEPSVSALADDTVTELGNPSDLQSLAETGDQVTGAPEVPDDQSVSSKISATSSKDEGRTTAKESQRSKSQTSTSSKKSGGRESKQSSKSSVKQKTEGGTDPVTQGKEYVEVAVQDEGGNPDVATVSSHQLDIVREHTGDFSNSYDLTDEESWASVPQDQMIGRFMQYRRLTCKRLAELEDQLATTVTKTHKKVDTLKAQFKEHKSKWEAERSVLVEQIGQAMRLQSEAEQEADTALSQLEDFIIEQEKLENLEDQKHEELSRQTTKLAEEAQAKLDAQAEATAQNATPAEEAPSGRASTVKGDNAETAPEITAHPEAMETKSPSRGSEGKDEQSEGEADGPEGDTDRPVSVSKEVEPELTNLLQQTDDAKVQELKRSSTTMSAVPTIETPVEVTTQRSQSAQEGPLATLETIVQNLEKMMSNESSLEPQQIKALSAVREAVKLKAKENSLSAHQATQTLAIISLAAQLAEESLKLGIKPGCFFNLFGKLNMAALEASELSEDVTDTEEHVKESSVDAADIVLAVPSDFQYPSAVPTDPHNSDENYQSLNEALPTVVLSPPPCTTPKTQTSNSTAQLGNLPHVDAPGADVMSRKCSPNVALSDSTGYREMVDAFTQWSEGDALGGISPESLEAVPDENLNLSSMSNEEIREVMSRRRASLRSEHKAKLMETRLAVEDRRSKSPAVSIPSLHSLDDDQLVEDDEDLDDLLPDNRKDSSGSFTAEKGTSPPSARKRKQSASPSVPSPFLPTPETPARASVKSQLRKASGVKGDNSIVLEYLEAYRGVVTFKEDLSKLLMDKDMMTASQMLTELESVEFHPEEDAEPQLSKMTKNLHYILDELTTLFGTILINDREPVVSSLVNFSRDPTATNLVTRERTEDSGQGFTPANSRTRSAASRQSDKCRSCDNDTVRELREACTLLQCQLDVEARKHQEQMRKNTQMMVEMQNTITELQKELAALTRAAKEPPPIPSIMFTRMDSERNSKIMKRAVYEDRLDAEQYQEAVHQMDQYVNLPAQRLAQLVRKYVHHKRMKQIEENVRHSKSLNENVFEILDKMEHLQNKRAKQWTDNMDGLGVERCRLASLLMETFDNIEQESGIFLIKPIYSFKGRDFKERYGGGKLSRVNRPNYEASPTRSGCRSAMAPAPTPVSNTRPGTRTSEGGRLGQTRSETALFARHAQFEPTTGVSGLGMVWAGGQPRPVWNLTNSQPKELTNDNLSTFANQNYNTPRILELDINRMLIGQNNVSTRVRAGLTDDRLVNAVNNSVRSYVTVNRPTMSPGQGRFMAEGTVPPSTPYRPSSSNGRTDRRRLPSSPPLPPIHLSRGGKVVEIHSPSGELSYPPRSPPGSSLRFTPPMKDREVPSPLDAFA